MPDRIDHPAVWIAAIVYFTFGWAWCSGIAPFATQTPNQALDAGYVVAGFAIVGAIVGGWKKKRTAAA